MYPDIVCGLDIGASSIRALIAQPMVDVPHTFEGKEKILGFAEYPTKGFSKGVVSNLDLLSDAIENAVSYAENIAGIRVRKVIANVSGVHIRTFKSRGSVHISDRPSEIRPPDVKRCIESAKLIAMSLDREVVHLIPERFYIDDKMEISQPLGLFGSKLDVDLNIITTLVSILYNLTKAINMAGYEVEELICSGAGTALSIFDHKELEDGAVIIDVGKDLTEASLFIDGRLKDSFYFPFGSDDLTHVLQDKLRIMFEDAEKLRTRCGIITKDNFEISEDGISKREISNLLFPKVEGIMQDVYKKIEPFLMQRKSLPHIRVVGGISKMDGFIETVEEIFGVPVEMGRVQAIEGLHDITFACSLGLARYSAGKRAEKKSKSIRDTDSFAGRILSRVRGVFSEYF